MSSSGSLKKNILVEAICRVATSLLALVLIPIIIRHVGVNGYGTWAVLMTISQVLLLFQSAITGTLLWSFSKAFNNRDEQIIQRLLGIGLTVNLIHFCGVFLVFLALRDWLFGIFKVPAMFMPIMLWVMAVAFVGGFVELTNTVVSGAQKMALSSSMRTAATFLQQIVSIAFLVQGYGLWALVIGFLANQILSLVGGRFLIRRVAPNLKMRFCWPTSQETAALRGYGGSLVVGCISATLRAQLDRLVLASFASLTWVGYYEIATRLCSLIFEFNRYFFMPLIPASAALHAQNKKAELNQLFTQFMTITGFATGMATVVVGGLHDRLMAAWIGSAPPEAILILCILLVSGFVQLILTGPGSAICRGIGEAKIETYYLTISLILNLILTIVLVKILGFIGTVIASAVATVVSGVCFCVVLHSRTSLPVSESWRTLRNCAAVLSSIALLRCLIVFVFPVSAQVTDRFHTFLGMLPLILLGMISYSILFVVFRAGDPKTIAFLPRRFAFLRFKRA